MIKKVGSSYKIYSKTKTKDGKHKVLGTFRSLSAAKERLRVIEYFKHKGK